RLMMYCFKLKQPRTRISQRPQYARRLLFARWQPNCSWERLHLNSAQRFVPKTMSALWCSKNDGFRCNGGTGIEILDLYFSWISDDESPHLWLTILAFYLDISDGSSDHCEFGFKEPLACQRIHAGGSTFRHTVVDVRLIGLDKGIEFRIDYGYLGAIG